MSDLKELASKIGVEKIGGSSLDQGKLYHDIPFMSLPSHRKNTRLRVDRILMEIDVKGKKGLDLGCSVGGITFRLQAAGASMTGIDYDKAMINLATAIGNKFKTSAKFVHSIINKELISGLEQYGFIVWFDQWMWLLKQAGEDAYECISIVSQKTNCLFFSTTQGDAMAKSANISSSQDVFNILKDNTDYQIDDLGTVKDGWYPRNIFRCYR